MKSAVILGERKAGLIEVPDPRAKEDWALVKIHYAPMCKEHKHFITGKKPAYLGHEAVGEVVEVAQPGHVKVGDRVAVMPQYPCEKCSYCLSGEYIFCENNYNYMEFTGLPYTESTYAQYILKPSWLLPKIPDNVSYESASVYCCGVGISFGAFQAMNLNAFDTVLITGLGQIGIGAIINAKYRGARVIAVESHEYRVILAKELGVDAVIHPGDENAVKKIKDLCNGIGPDCAVDCSGTVAAHRLCIDAVRRRGQVAFVGECYEETPVRISPDMIRKGLKLIGIWAYNLNDFPDIMKVIENSPLVSRLVTHVFPLSEIQKAFEVSATFEHSKILLKPWE